MAGAITRGSVAPVDLEETVVGQVEIVRLSA